MFSLCWLTHLFILARQHSFSRFPRKSAVLSGLHFFSPLSTLSLSILHKHLQINTLIFTHASYVYIWTIPEFEPLSVPMSGDRCGMLSHCCSGKIPDARKLISPPWMGHVLGQEVLHQAPLKCLGDCTSQPNGNKAQGMGRSLLHLHPCPWRLVSGMCYKFPDHIFPSRVHFSSRATHVVYIWV